MAARELRGSSVPLSFQVETPCSLSLWAASGWGPGEEAPAVVQGSQGTAGVFATAAGCLLLEPRVFMTVPCAQPRGCFMGHCVPGATPQTGPGL